MVGFYTCLVLVAMGLSRFTLGLDVLKTNRWASLVGFVDLNASFDKVWRNYAFLINLFILYILVRNICECDM